MSNNKGSGLGEVIDEIAQLRHFHSFACKKCGLRIRYHVLEGYVSCQKCNTQHKVRGFGGIGTEIQDVIDAVLEWTGEGETFEAVLRRHKVIQDDKDDD